MSTPAEIWRKYDGMERRLTAALTQRMLDLARLAPGMRVLDVGSGRGEPAIPAAHRVAPSGKVYGVDSSDAILQLARERADEENVANLELLAKPAEELSAVALTDFDAALARWSLMYFANPHAVLSGIVRALKPTRLFVAALWAEPERVSYFSLPRDVLARYAAVPEVDFEMPGVFRYAHVDRIARDFSAAGLSVQYIEELDTPVMEYREPRELVEWVRVFGMSALLKGVSPEIEAAWERDLVREVRALSNDGLLRLGGVTRIVVATVIRARPSRKDHPFGG